MLQHLPLPHHQLLLPPGLSLLQLSKRSKTTFSTGVLGRKFRDVGIKIDGTQKQGRRRFQEKTRKGKEEEKKMMCERSEVDDNGRKTHMKG